MQLTVFHGGLGQPLLLPADGVLVRSDAGTLLAILHEWGPSGWTMTCVGDPDFAAVAAKLGIDRVAVVDKTAPVPTVGMLDHPR